MLEAGAWAFAAALSCGSETHPLTLTENTRIAQNDTYKAPAALHH